MNVRHKIRSEQKMTPINRRRNMMYTMNVSQWMDKVGNAFVNTVLLAALPTAMVAILVQAF